MRGWVYIAENDSLQDMVKIGFTDSDPATRMASLSNTSIPTPFRVVYEVLIDSPFELEQMLHRHFSEERVSESREFFRVTPQMVVDRLREFSSENDLVIHLENSYFEGVDYTVPCTLKNLQTQRDAFEISMREDIKSFRKWIRKQKGQDAEKTLEKWVDREVGLQKTVTNVLSDDYLASRLWSFNKKFDSLEDLNESIEKTFWSKFFIACPWLGELTRNQEGEYEFNRFMCRKCNFSGDSSDFQITKNSLDQHYFACPRCTHWNSWILR